MNNHKEHEKEIYSSDEDINEENIKVSHDLKRLVSKMYDIQYKIHELSIDIKEKINNTSECLETIENELLKDSIEGENRIHGLLKEYKNVLERTESIEKNMDNHLDPYFNAIHNVWMDEASERVFNKFFKGK